MSYVTIVCSVCGKKFNHSTMHDVSGGAGKKFMCSKDFSEFVEQPDEKRFLDNVRKSDMRYETTW